VTRPPTAAQRRVIDAADPVTGRLRGTEAQLAALVRRGLAFRHPRPPHDHFLTPAGTDGYRVRATPQPEAVAVHGPDDATLRACAATLEKAGWQVGEHTDPRTRARYLLASPRRV